MQGHQDAGAGAVLACPLEQCLWPADPFAIAARQRLAEEALLQTPAALL